MANIALVKTWCWKRCSSTWKSMNIAVHGSYSRVHSTAITKHLLWIKDAPGNTLLKWFSLSEQIMPLSFVQQTCTMKCFKHIASQPVLHRRNSSLSPTESKVFTVQCFPCVQLYILICTWYIMWLHFATHMPLVPYPHSVSVVTGNGMIYLRNNGTQQRPFR